MPNICPFCNNKIKHDGPHYLCQHMADMERMHDLYQRGRWTATEFDMVMHAENRLRAKSTIVDPETGQVLAEKGDTLRDDALDAVLWLADNFPADFVVDFDLMTVKQIERS